MLKINPFALILHTGNRRNRFSQKIVRGILGCSIKEVNIACVEDFNMVLDEMYISELKLHLNQFLPKLMNLLIN